RPALNKHQGPFGVTGREGPPPFSRLAPWALHGVRRDRPPAAGEATALAEAPGRETRDGAAGRDAPVRGADAYFGRGGGRDTATRGTALRRGRPGRRAVSGSAWQVAPRPRRDRAGLLEG